MTSTPITRHEPEQLAHILVELALNAADEIMAIYANEFDVKMKADASPVTLADKRAETVILDGLRQLEPDIDVIAEEAYAAGESGEIGDVFFLVDPLDGTREFIKRNDEFTVNIALIVGNSPQIGVVVAPALSQTYYAFAPGEAFVATKTGPDKPIRVRPSNPNHVVAIASRSHSDEQTKSYLSELGVGETISAGSSLKFCLLAAGKADIYPRFGPTCEWDIAAGHAILRAAGGNLCTIDGSEFCYGKQRDKFLNPGFIAWGAGDRPRLPGT